MVEMKMQDQDNSPYFRDIRRPVTSVEHSNGDWSIWNWLTHKWDVITDSERVSIKRAEAQSQYSNPIVRMDKAEPPGQSAKLCIFRKDGSEQIVEDPVQAHELWTKHRATVEIRNEPSRRERDAGLRTQTEEYLAWRETQAWEE